MKKNLFVGLLMVLAISVSAQDTIRYGYPCYFFNPLLYPSPGMDPNGNIIGYVKAGTSGAGYEYVLPENEEIIVYGIALTADRPKDDLDSAGYTVYMYVVGDSNRMICVDSATEYSVATEFLYYGQQDTIYAESLVPCYEYYFSQPHIINEDAIYLGARWSYSFVPRYSLYFGSDLCFCHSVVYLDSDTLRYAGHNSFWWGGLFPITKTHCDSCPEVHNVQCFSLGNGAAMVVWDTSDNHHDWQLCYGPQGFTPDSALARTTTVPLDTLTGLSDTTPYDIYIRAHCVCCPNDEWTPWAGPFALNLSGVGIDEAAAPEVTLSPNPTTGKLTIGCAAEIKEVEMYDMQGRMISGKWKEESGKSVVLDLAGLPAGSYILVAHTTKGVATRTVEKR